MSKYSKRLVAKPPHLKDKDLVAIITLGETPVSPNNPDNPPYRMSQLAVNRPLKLIQVYVEADNNGGLNKFKNDFPSHVVQADATLENPDNWEILAFPSEATLDESTPLDSYYQGRNKELVR